MKSKAKFNNSWCSLTDARAKLGWRTNDERVEGEPPLGSIGAKPLVRVRGLQLVECR
jgi:hypothetical protein